MTEQPQTLQRRREHRTAQVREEYTILRTLEEDYATHPDSHSSDIKFISKLHAATRALEPLATSAPEGY